MPRNYQMPLPIIVILLAVLAGPTMAQQDTAKTESTVAVRITADEFLLPLTEVDADPAIPTSEQVLRYRWGDDVSSHYQIETYLRALTNAAPDRTKLVQYGTSCEGRSLNYLVISSAANIQRLEEIRQNNLRLADPRSLPESDSTALAEDSPAIVWLAYCVHGNEISPSDAGLLTAYHLLADRRPETRTMLDQLVIIIDPLQNPDGRDRFVNVFRETRGNFLQSNPLANEHTERWPSGRSNHYWFDMNRDWFRHSQREVRAKVAAFLDWIPQIYVDAHEMGADSTYYFPPPADPKNPFLLPAQHEWFSQLGKHQAGWFDRYGFGYVTREMFDAFYPGYGSEWPTLQGGLGILWEQASPRGLIVDRDDETQLTYHDAVRNHYVSGIATIEFAAAKRTGLLKSFYQSRLAGVRLGSDGPVRHYFLPGDRPQRTADLMALLERNGIEVYTLSESISVDCTDMSGAEATRTIAAGSFHVPVAQPGGRLLRSLFDRNVEMDEKFLRRQLERNQLRLPDEIYDVTAWSMPLAFGVECFSTDASVNVASERWMQPDFQNLAELPVAKVAYLIPPTDGAMKLLSRLLQRDVRVHVNDEPFTLNDREHPQGTLIVKVSGNSVELPELLHEANRGLGVEIVGTDTAYVQKGAHMGGPDVYWVRPPKVLLVVNEPTNYSSGHTWYLFDEVLGYPTTRVKGEHLSGVDLSKFNTIVLPDGNYESEYDKSVATRLGDWVSSGGTLITLRGATEWAVSEDIGLLKNELLKRKVEPVKKSTDEKTDDDEPEMVAPDNVPGAFFNASVFTRNWVTFGCEPEMDVFYSGQVVLGPTAETAGRSLVTFAKKDDLLSSGFCWQTGMELLAETPYAVYRSHGSGHVIGFVDDPNYRAMYPSLQRLFINATMLGAGH